MITIKEIAKLANVSIGTVDRVLHDRGEVSKETSKKIKAIISKHKFKANRVAQSLAMKKRFKLTVLIPSFDKNNLFWKSPFMGIKAATEEFENFGIRVRTFTYDQLDAKSYKDQFNKLMESKPDGVILVPTFNKETTEVTQVLDTNSIPYVFLNIDIKGFNNKSYIGQDSFKGGFLAGRLMQLCLTNNSEIVTIHSRPNLSNIHNISERIKGFEAYFSEKKLNFKNHSLEFEDFENIDFVKEKVQQVFNENKALKGIFIPSSRASIVANCFDDISNIPYIIGFDTTDQNLAALHTERITFLISQKSYDQGYKAVECMTEYFLKNGAIVPQIFSPIEIITAENVEFIQNKKNGLFS